MILAVWRASCASSPEQIEGCAPVRGTIWITRAASKRACANWIDATGCLNCTSFLFDGLPVRGMVVRLTDA